MLRLNCRVPLKESKLTKTTRKERKAKVKLISVALRR